MSFSQYIINNKKELILLQDKLCNYDHIIINSKSLKYDGLLRHAFKYALWSLHLGGTIEILDEPSRSTGLSKNHVDFWQVKSELFRTIGSYIETQIINEKEGILLATKTSETYINTGISFAILFSGSEAEIPLLERQLKSIAIAIQNISDKYVEVNLIAPSKFDTNRIKKLAFDIAINHIDFDDELPNNRVPIGKKKNFAISTASHNVVVLSHTRMEFSPDFAKKLMQKKFDLLTPEVYFRKSHNNSIRYLDITFTGNYDYNKKNTTKVFSSLSIPKDYMSLFKKHVAYLDGGITIVNKNVIGRAIYCNNLAWGEGEDVDMASRAYAAGCLLDVDPTLTCFSQTSKLIEPNFIRMTAQKFKVLLNFVIK